MYDYQNLTELEDAVLELTDRVDVLAKNLARQPSDAGAPSGSDFNALVADEMRKGLTYEIAAQRVELKHGVRPDASHVRKSQSASTHFMAAVDTLVMKKCLARADAMSAARKLHPDLYAAFHEA